MAYLDAAEALAYLDAKASAKANSRFPSFGYAQDEWKTRKASASETASATATADSLPSAALRMNGRQEKQVQVQQQIPPLRYGMTTNET